jgi:hypothetical protein
VRVIDTAERRARLAHRHHLTPSARAVSEEDVARDLVALHATDPATVFLSLRARVRGATPARIERALYEAGGLVRMLGMRRTMFVVPVERAPSIHAAATRAIATRERTRLLELLSTAGVAADPARWLARVERDTAAALAARGEATGAEISADVPALRTQVLLAEGKAYEARVNLTTRVLFLMAAEGRIVRGRPKGSWVSSQFRWAPVERRFPDGLPELETEPAVADLVGWWLSGFGPGTMADLRWWTGLTAKAVSGALSRLGAEAVELDGGGTGFLLSGDHEQVRPPKPWVAFAPALDPTVMGWIERAWYLGEHGPALFDRSGNPGPTVWWDGRIVGGWAQHRDGRVVFRLLEDVGSEAVARVEAEAARVEAWLGDVRVRPRFRTPLEKELGA